MDYRNFERVRKELLEDVYDQPPDPGHTALAQEFINWSHGILHFEYKTILDVGCGQGFCKPMFEEKNAVWEGVTTGEDYAICKRKNLPVHNQDMTFLQFPHHHFNILFARHVLEHSPYPIMTLFEWYRVAQDYLLVVVPVPGDTVLGGKNHYSVLNKSQWWTLFTRSGWWPKSQKTITTHSPEFLNHWRPEVEGSDREGMIYPGAPREMEFWYILEKGEKRIE